MNSSGTLMSKDVLRRFFSDINKKSDQVINVALALYFATGLVLATFYDTYSIAIGVGTLCLVSYYGTKAMLPNSDLYRYVLAVVLGVFAAQYIYQMHGMFEMHFIFFVGSALLIAYQNWKLQIPLILFIVVHHGTFAYLQFTGLKEVYFTQMEFMDLSTFIIHAAVATTIIFINGFWAFLFERRTKSDGQNRSQLEHQLSNIKNNIQFADEISGGNLDSQVKMDENDLLGKSLLQMRTNLIDANRRERLEKYVTQGVATIGEILRKNTDNVDRLADELIREIVKYTNSNQGGMFLLETEENQDQYLRLASCYAYDRKKFMDKKLGIGESLVGQCFLEKDIILLTQVPKDYVKITSGLGLATPACVLLIPVMANDQVTGVIELASFEKYDESAMEFLRKASEAIATSIISAQTTEHIKTLLNDSQQRAEELRAQEEEMRQNMEELTATQEEMIRKSVETENRIKAINESGIASIEFNLDGTILEANQSFLDLMGYTLGEIQGRHHSIFTLPHYASKEEYRKFWEDLRNGIPRPGEFHRVTKSGKKIYIKGSYSILRDHHGNPVRVMKLATDITSMMVQQEELNQNMKSLNVIQGQVQNNRAEMQSTLNAINESLAVIEFNPQGEVLYANTNFLNLMGYKLDEIIGKHHRMFVGQTEQTSERYAKFWKDLADGQTLKGEFNRIHKKGEIIRIRGNYSPIKNHNDQVEKIIKIAYEVEEDIIPERLRREMSAF